MLKCIFAVTLYKMERNGFSYRFARMGDMLRGWLCGELRNDALDAAVEAGAEANPFFTPYMQKRALAALANGFLDKEVLEKWYSGLPEPVHASGSGLHVCGIVAAGNIPAVAFHDILCVLAAGWRPLVKLSSRDRWLLPVLFPDVEFCADTDGWKIDALLSMGSDEAAAHFGRMFPDVPKVLRASRFSCALLNGSESPAELDALAEDMLLYYGLGCRSVTCLLVPQNYDFSGIIRAAERFAQARCGQLLMDNYLKSKAVMILAGEHFVDGNVLVFADAVKAAGLHGGDLSGCRINALHLPLGTVWYVPFSSDEDVGKFTEANRCGIQKIFRNFGSAQQPDPADYPDGVDIPQFLNRIAKNML